MSELEKVKAEIVETQKEIEGLKKKIKALEKKINDSLTSEEEKEVKADLDRKEQRLTAETSNLAELRKKELFLLQQSVAAQQASQRGEQSFELVHNKLDAISERIARMEIAAPPSLSSTQIADRELSKKQPLPSTTAGGDTYGLDAIETLSYTTEKVFDALVASHLQRLFAPWIVLNGEDHQWIDTKGAKQNRQKADFNVCHPALALHKAPPSCKSAPKISKIRQEASRNNKPLLYGIPADWRLRDGVIVIESKMPDKLKQGLGDMIVYLFHLSIDPCLDESAPRRFGLVFTSKEFYLVLVERTVVIRLYYGEWKTAGCGAAIRDILFPLKPNLMGAIPTWLHDAQKLCDNLQVDFDVNPTKPAFLGMGAYGRVFRVHKLATNKTMAFKMASSNKSWDLCGQFEALCDAKSKQANVVTVHSWTKLENGAGAYLIDEVGEPIDQGKKAQADEILKALRQLHCAGCVHGDCRLNNLIRFENKLLWIDLKGTKAFLPTNIAEDIQQLCRSMGLQERNQEVLRAYANDVYNDERFAELLGQANAV